jgi:hypothetical protein
MSAVCSDGREQTNAPDPSRRRKQAVPHYKLKQSVVLEWACSQESYWRSSNYAVGIHTSSFQMCVLSPPLENRGVSTIVDVVAMMNQSRNLAIDCWKTKLIVLLTSRRCLLKKLLDLRCECVNEETAFFRQQGMGRLDFCFSMQHSARTRLCQRSSAGTLGTFRQDVQRYALDTAISYTPGASSSASFATASDSGPWFKGCIDATYQGRAHPEGCKSTISQKQMADWSFTAYCED